MFHVKQFKRIEQYCKKSHLKYSDEQDLLFQHFCNTLLENNKTINLTAVTEPREIEIKHFIDSLAAVPFINQYIQENYLTKQQEKCLFFPDSNVLIHDQENVTECMRETMIIKQAHGCKSDTADGRRNEKIHSFIRAYSAVQSTTTMSHKEEQNHSAPAIQENNIEYRHLNGCSVVDIGTGAGFPGIPLAIMLQNVSFTLADSLNKRIDFLKRFVTSEALTNVKALQGRAEELGQSDLRENFDICVSRAVADMSVLLEYCLPLIKVNGKTILYKSGNYQEELESSNAALNVLGGKLEKVVTFQLPDTDYNRSLIIIEKVKETPLKYPRRPGKPSKSPIRV